MVAAALERERCKYAAKWGTFRGFKEMGVFWDWLSLFQKDPSLYVAEPPPDEPRGGAAYEASRPPEQKAAFRRALHETHSERGGNAAALSFLFLFALVVRVSNVSKIAAHFPKRIKKYHADTASKQTQRHALSREERQLKLSLSFFSS